MYHADDYTKKTLFVCFVKKSSSYEVSPRGTRLNSLVHTHTFNDALFCLACIIKLRNTIICSGNLSCQD